jgi:hypothetical protein
LAARVAAGLSGGAGLAVVETAIRAGLMGLGAGLAEALLGTDLGYRGPRIDCPAGHPAGFVGYRGKTVTTVLGPVRLRRAWYHCPTCRAGAAPRDGELGVAGETMSPGMRRMAARTGSMVAFAAAADLIGELAGITLTGPRVRRHAEADGATAADLVVAEAAAIRARDLIPAAPDPVPDILYIAVDGTGVPMVPAETQDRPGKSPDGHAVTREVKLACLFTQTTLEADDRPVRDPASSSYLATFEPAEPFGHLVSGEATRRGSEYIRQLVVLGDGAHWIWNLATARLPQATQIVDLYHAREHLHALADLARPVTGADHPTWLSDRLEELDDGDIEALLAAARALPLTGDQAAERDTEAGYFQTNTIRMRYKRFRELGMFIGSGAVEAGCKAIVAQRLKLSGMRWTVPGATAVLTLRTQHANARLDRIWTQPRNHTRAA